MCFDCSLVLYTAMLPTMFWQEWSIFLRFLFYIFNYLASYRPFSHWSSRASSDCLFQTRLERDATPCSRHNTSYNTWKFPISIFNSQGSSRPFSHWPSRASSDCSVLARLVSIATLALAVILLTVFRHQWNIFCISSWHPQFLGFSPTIPSLNFQSLVWLFFSSASWKGRDSLLCCNTVLPTVFCHLCSTFFFVLLLDILSSQASSRPFSHWPSRALSDCTFLARLVSIKSP